MDEFSDDDLDGLEEDDLLALEDDSAPPTQTLSHQPSYVAQTTRFDSDIHTNGSTRQYGAAISLNHNYQQSSISSQSISKPARVLPNSNYGNFSVRVNAQEPGPSTQREQWRAQRYAATTPGLQKASTSGSITLPLRDPGARPTQYPEVETNVGSSHGQPDVSAELMRLRRELAQAKREQHLLRLEAKAANDEKLAKAGEVSILRSQHVKNAADFEKRLEDIQKRHLLDTERHQAEIEQSRRERERLASHNQFLNHERNDDNWQLKSNTRPQAPEKQIRRSESNAAKRPRPSHFGDGFDDDEVMVISPSKNASRSRNTTPKGGLKRKRDALADSPLKPLDLSQSIGYLPENDIDLPIVQPPLQQPSTKKQINSFKFLQKLLKRQCGRDNKRTFEVLSDYSLPSDPANSLSTILTEKIASVSIDNDAEDFQSIVGHIIMSLWSRCLEEQYYKPVRYLLDLMQFTLYESPSSSFANLLDVVVDLIQRTADINVIPRYKRFKRKTAADDPDSQALSSDISTKECLEMLDLVVTVCGRDQELIKRYWKSMRFDFISMLLRNSQDVNDISLMVKILCRSVRTDTFAMIVAPPASQSISEQHVIDRLSAMLIETPRVLETEPPPTTIEIADMRLEVLNLIEIMSTRRYCGDGFCSHPAALGRLVRVMHDELNALYQHIYGHEKRAELVNVSTRLLYHLTKDYSSTIGNIQDKLRHPPTSVYKHLIVLSRLAFSEGIVFEENIDEDVLEMAHEMLELLTSPEEAEAVERAFRRDMVISGGNAMAREETAMQE